jgi:myosin heavy subunit
MDLSPIWHVFGSRLVIFGSVSGFWQPRGELFPAVPMNSVSPQTSDPSVLLLNEIDILLAQMRLIELYVKQAQAAAANHTVGLHQQHQAEIVRLRTELADKERISQQHAASQLADLTAQLKDKQHSLDQYAKQLDAPRNEIATLLERQSTVEAELAEINKTVQTRNEEVVRLNTKLADLVHEQANSRTAVQGLEQSRSASDAELGELRHQLEQKTIESNQDQTRWAVSEQQYRDQIAALRRELDERVTAASIRSDMAVNSPQPARLEAIPNERIKIVAHSDVKPPHSRRWQSRFTAQRRWKV